MNEAVNFQQKKPGWINISFKHRNIPCDMKYQLICRHI